MDDENDQKPDAPSFTSAAELFGIGADQGIADPSLSQAPGLREVPNSRVPFAAHSHVMGPGQAAVDPVAAGLDMCARPLSYAESRAVTASDGLIQPATKDHDAERAPGPTGGTGSPATEATIKGQSATGIVSTEQGPTAMESALTPDHDETGHSSTAASDPA